MINWAHFHLLVNDVPILASLLTRRRGGSYSRGLLAVLLAVMIVSASVLCWTGLAGGRISHPELQLPGDRDTGPAHPH